MIFGYNDETGDFMFPDASEYENIGDFLGIIHQRIYDYIDGNISDMEWEYSHVSIRTEYEKISCGIWQDTEQNYYYIPYRALFGSDDKWIEWIKEDRNVRLEAERKEREKAERARKREYEASERAEFRRLKNKYGEK